MSAAATAIIARLRVAGATLECRDGGRVRFSAPVPLPAALLAEARRHREAIAAVLVSNTAPANHAAPDDPAALSGYLRAALQRPPSWADPAALPSRGCFCSCCKEQRWWCEREASKGWRCSTCHPPDHLPANAIMEVTT